MRKNIEPKTDFDQQIHVSIANKEKAQKAFDYAKRLEQDGNQLGAEYYRSQGRQILGLGLIQGVAHGESASVKITKGRTAKGEEFVTVVADASNDSRLPKQFIKDHRRAIAMTSQGPISNTMLNTTSNLFADNAIKVVKTIGRGLRKTFSTFWDLSKKGLETQRAAQTFRQRQRDLVEHEAKKLSNKSKPIELTEGAKNTAQKIETDEWQRQQNRQTELRNSEVITVYKKRGGKILTVVEHEESDNPW